jgi:hypothetical protein
VKGNKFTEEQAKQELTLRAQFLNVTKSFFASKLERGRALMEYQVFYTPLGMLSDFLKVVGVDPEPLATGFCGLRAGVVDADVSRELGH